MAAIGPEASGNDALQELEVEGPLAYVFDPVQHLGVSGAQVVLRSNDCIYTSQLSVRNDFLFIDIC